MAQHPHSTQSFWIQSTETASTYPTLIRETFDGVSVDVAIVGAGIAGLTTAYQLQKAGKTVAVIEAGAIATGVSGHTTAKVTALHQLIYAQLVKKVGADKARLYAESNQAAVEFVADLVQREQIDCDFSRRTAYTFADSAEQLQAIKDEVEAAVELGLPAAFVTETDLPFAIEGAIALDQQAQFHPRRYLTHLAQKIADGSSYVFEQSRVLEVNDGDPCQVVTDQGVVHAKDVVVTTNLPFLDQGLFFAKTYPQRSYIIAAPIEGDRAPQGMYIGTGEGYRSIRTTPDQDRHLLLIGGEGHKVGTDDATPERFERLEAYARSQFGVSEIAYRWSSQDFVSFDQLPYIGKLSPLQSHIYIATGFSLWGMTKGTLAGLILSDTLLGMENPWADLYDSLRATPFVSQQSLKQNLDVGMHWVGDRLKGLQNQSFDDVALGEGKLITVNGKKTAAYRDEAGQIHAVSPVCTHLGCIVNWNAAEKSWDCPCHGGRFSCDGKVLHGPPVKDLEAFETAATPATPSST
jgi:glycine/D-amino acid oxidase-like deaminating enzyme/nitrite reductase/ring-hydroxylating ferredoxin subunit